MSRGSGIDLAQIGGSICHVQFTRAEFRGRFAEHGDTRNMHRHRIRNISRSRSAWRSPLPSPKRARGPASVRRPRPSPSQGAECRLLAAALDAARAVGTGNDAARHARQAAAPDDLHALRRPEGLPGRQLHGRQQQGNHRGRRQALRREVRIVPRQGGLGRRAKHRDRYCPHPRCWLS